MVEFINRVTESQASDKVHKVLRANPDKKRSQPEQKKSDAEKKEETEELKDEIVLSEVAANSGADKKPDEELQKEKEAKKELSDNKDEENPSGHIDVTG